tara:strand:+ start:2052 stop:3293 length:1242 start_codon:yes stop_codon:yes gene_type:complete
MSVLKISHPTICDFYNDNPQFDVEKVNLAVIELLKLVNKNQNDSNSANSVIMQNIQNALCSDVVQNHQQELIEKNMSELKTLLKELNNSDKPNTSHMDTIKEYINNFEMKSSLLLQNAQQPIYSFLSSSEDRLQQSISSIKKETSLDDESRTMLKDISNMLSRLPDCICSEDALSKKLTKLYNTADIRNISCEEDKQVVLMKRFRKPTTFFQVISQDENVNGEQITEMLACLSEQNCNGILLSSQSGFSGKKDFHIDIHNNNIIVYIHNFAKNEDKLQMAIHIVDGFISRMNEVSNVSTTGVHITQDLLEKINNEYQLFISQKTAVVDLLKENQKKVINQMDEIKFPCLDKYLSTKFSAPVATCGLKCDVCKNYSANNLKALAAHKRGCLRKHPNFNKKSDDLENVKPNVMIR